MHYSVQHRHYNTLMSCY